MDASNTGQREGGNRSRWVVAVFAALLTHVLILGGIQWAGMFRPGEATATPTPVKLVFAPRPEAPKEPGPEQPSFFSELPEDRADLRPEDPDFLSNVDSRARDRIIEDETTDLPRMEGRSESPHVRLDGSPGTTEGEPVQGEPGEDVLSREQPGGGSEAEQDLDAADPAKRDRVGAAALEDVLADRGGGRQGEPSERSGGLRGSGGSGGDATRLKSGGTEARYSLRAQGGDVFQEEMDNRRGNVSLFGDISLNTLNWEFAPWIQRFIRDYHRNWFPPYAYLALGLIYGYQLVDLEVAPDGRLLKLEVVDEEGHEALKESTLTTFRAYAPYRPLPADFPEPTLKLRIKVIYPRLR